MEGTDALWTLQELKKNVSATFDWDLFFKNLVSDELYHKIIYDKSDLVVQLDTPVFLKNVINMIQTSKDRDLQNYAIWRLVKYSLPYLSSEYTAALNDFNNAFPGSASKETPRAGVCLSYIKGNFELPNLGFATSEAYGKKHFLIDAQEASKQIVVNVKAGLEQLITSADWMDNTTRKNALDKAGKMDVLMAYPDWTMNQTAQNQYYKNLKIPPSVSFISLNLMLRGWAVQKNFEGVLKPVDRKDFVGSPVRTDAWYSKSTNAFTMPVGELQYPFYGYGSPLAMNYGAAGAVAGHEMSHGFDVDGSQYDTNGNLANWWSPASKKQFEDRTKCLIDQFNHYCFKGAGCVNGRITAAENAADLGGLKAAYQAFKALPPQPTLARAPMFSSDQLFYLSFSSFYCNSQSLDEIKDDLASNGHSPAKYRVIGTLRNIPEFSKAFSCKLGSYMNPEKKCAIW
ncbi:hypothetical protein L596_013050 [Steinernema carpocapsae]|uniref:Peptidase M13 C-terminal domain-containing protein n=1 Tax=Steinernema carpocapsae TaxID=34508 RepID=A0A4V6A509_STECR|nr:hypothetical protein L596_013050 [Steinernema carpocapsae]